MSTSELATLRQQLDMMCEAMNRALKGYAVSATHDIIQHRYETLGALEQELAHHVGEEQAHQIVCETYIDKVG